MIDVLLSLRPIAIDVAPPKLPAGRARGGRSAPLGRRLLDPVRAAMRKTSTAAAEPATAIAENRSDAVQRARDLERRASLRQVRVAARRARRSTPC